MSATKGKGPVIESGLCRCCGGTKRCRLLNVEYEWQGQKEVYSDMFVDCFGLLLSHLDGEASERVICATCVSRLREAAAFRKQVLSCEEQLLKTKIHVHGDASDVICSINVKEEVEELKIEVDDSAMLLPEKPQIVEVPLFNDVNDDMDCDDDHIDDDNISLASLRIEHKKQMKLQKHKKKLSKAKLSSKLTTNKALLNGEYMKMKKLLQKKLRKAKREEDLLNEKPIHYLPAQPELQLKPRPKVIEAEQKSYLNTVTIVENSYVCPFTTSFSDYYCIYCRHTFTDPSKLREHTLEHDPTTFKDIFDNKKFAQIDILRVDCRLCPTPIDDLDALKEHLQRVHGKLIYPVTNEFLKFKLTLSNLTCIECKETNFKFFHALKKHMAEHFGTCICDICGAHYFEERVLIIHQKTHQKSTEEVFPCKDCGKTFKSRHNRYLHEAKVHKKEAAYPCSKCDEVFFSYTLRYRHLIDVHGEERMFPCDVCDRVYDSRKSLREHNRRSHLKIMKHQCDLCDRRFYLPSRLKEHMSTHTGERNYRCEYCGKSYPRLRGLKVHMQSHSAEKKFRCMLCNASFTQNVNLKNHMKRQHQSIDMDDSYHGTV